MRALFQRPIGAAADVKELEYIAALLQTTDSNREEFVDASVDARDIKYHLLSRYGLKISLEQVRYTILAGLGGGDSEDDCLDICEIAATLFIPTLRKIVDEAELVKDTTLSFRHKHEESDDEAGAPLQEFSKDLSRDILEHTLKNILIRATGSSKPQPLTEDLIREIFAAFDEMDLVTDDTLVAEMIKTAKGQSAHDPVLDVETFACALTYDVMRYDPTTEDRATSHFVDALGGSSAKLRVLGRDPPEGDKPKSKSTAADDGKDGIKKKRIPRGEVKGEFTAASLDFTAETFRSRLHVILAYVGFVVSYIQYVVGYEVFDVCSSDSYGCRIVQSIFGYAVIMGVMTILGTLYFGMVCAGNDVNCKNPKVVFVSILGTIIFYFAPLVIKVDAKVLSTKVNSFESRFLEIILIVLGCLLLICQLVNVLRVVSSDEYIGDHKYMSFLVAGSNARNERQTKRAAAHKVTRMLRNAYELHKDDDDNGKAFRMGEESTHEKALLNFTMIQGRTEETGGFFNSWISLLNGDILSKEGVWIHTRIYAGLVAQFGLFIAFIVAYALLADDLINYLYESAPVTERCGAAFDIVDCIAPEQDGVNFGFLQCDLVVISGKECLDRASVATGELREIGCDRFPRFYANSCDEIDFIKFGSIVATARGDNIAGAGEEECNALLSTCVLLERVDDTTTLATCLVGMDEFFSPYWFWGSGCENYFPIKQILDSRPPMLKSLGDKVHANYDKIKSEINNFDDVTPEKWMLEACLIVGLIMGIISFLLIIVSYIPSTIATVLQFRSGVIPSLRDPRFIEYRRTLEDSTYIFGLMSWGVIFSAAATIFIFAGITFLFVWQVTRPLVTTFFASLLGIFSTIGVKSMLVVVLDKFNYVAFYRKRPYLSNICGVALECWHIAIGYAYLMIRAIILLGAAAMNVGRIDRPFLGDGVGSMGKVTTDKFPLVYRKDILLAEAHRHPYIERLGLMYLMKIRNGVKFATNAGSVWRLLFVFSLMPWLRKFRISNDAFIPEGLLMQKLGLGRTDEKSEEVKKLQDENRVLKTEIKSWIEWQRESMPSKHKEGMTSYREKGGSGSYRNDYAW